MSSGRSGLFQFLVLTSLVLGNISFAKPVFVDPMLREFMNRDASNERVTAILLMANSAKKTPAPKRYRSNEVIQYLKSQLDQSRSELQRFTTAKKLSQADFKIKRGYYTINGFSVRVSQQGLSALMQHPMIYKIYANRKLGFDRPKLGAFDRPDADIPYDVVQIGLDKVFAEFPEVKGTGVTLGSVDTGVEGVHPALNGKIKVFYDGKKKKVVEPFDSDSHGTHTNGTMVGSAREGVAMGMAPDANMVASGPLSGYDDMINSMEFMLDPDQDPSTNDMPRAINNSWNTRGAPDQEIFYRAIDAWEAVGVLPVFSAGNAGPSDKSITPPHEHPLAFAVGATGQDAKVTSFSSRGPALFRGQEIKKPDLAAPGKDILSSVPGKKYQTMSGTSMAAPHVTGVTALLCQVDPKLNPAQIRKVILDTLNFVDEKGEPIQSPAWNKAYGYGRLNIYEAVKRVKGLARSRSGLGISFFEQAMESPIKLWEKSVLMLE